MVSMMRFGVYVPSLATIVRFVYMLYGVLVNSSTLLPTSAASMP